MTEPMIPAPYSVRDVWSETRDVFSIALEPSAEPVPSGAPGQFNMLWAFGVGEAPISISGASASGAPLVHTIRAVGNVTRALCAVAPGDPVGVRGPFGSCWPVEAARGRDVVVVAGGIGLAPLRPVLYHLETQREDYGRVALLYGTRSPDDILFRSELENWRARFDLDVYVTVDAAPPGWGSNVGAVTQLVPSIPFDPADAIALVCGPEVMMHFATRALVDRGVRRDAIHLSMERNMQCAVGLCGHCQWGAEFVCKTGPVYPLSRIERLLAVRER
ncbi:MAG: FAD/NAD(P)-binding protein [Myxococcota bacterium]